MISEGRVQEGIVNSEEACDDFDKDASEADGDAQDTAKATPEVLSENLGTATPKSALSRSPSGICVSQSPAAGSASVSARTATESVGCKWLRTRDDRDGDGNCQSATYFMDRLNLASILIQGNLGHL